MQLLFDNQSKADLILKNVGIDGQMKTARPGNRTFIEDVSPSRYNTLRIAKGEEVYARQFNPESFKTNMIEVDGGLLWLLGLKNRGTCHPLRSKKTRQSGSSRQR